MRRAIAVAFALSLAGEVVAGQSATPAAAGSFEVSGVVVNARTGQPMPRVTMSLRDAVARATIPDAETDAEGRFRFDHVTKGRYDLLAQRPGGGWQAFEQHEGGVSTAIVTGEGKVSTGLRFSLEPLASIHGTVTEDSGDPVPRASVMLFREMPGEGGQKMVRAGGTVANEAGEYEVARLAPGMYAVCVSGRPWYAWTRRIPQTADSAPRSPLDVAYQMACYPGVTDAAEAEQVALRAGDRLELPLTLHAVPAVHVTIPLSEDERTHGMQLPRFSTEVFGTEEFEQASAETWSVEPDSQGRGRAMILSIAPGQYRAEFMGQNGRPEKQAIVDASGDRASLDTAAAVSDADVRGTVAMSNGGSLPQGTGIFLRPDRGNGQGAEVLPKGEFHFESVPSGKYRIEVGSRAGRMGLAQVMANGAPVRGGMLTVGSEPMTLSLSLIQGVATLAGEVHRDDAAASGVFVLLVPSDRHAAVVPNQSDSDGTFEFRNVLPGAYTVVAIEDGWTLNWQSREVLGRYLAGGLKVTISGNARTVDLPGPVQAQAK
jgi:hypothetical protein